MTQVIQAEDLLTALAQWFDGGAEDDEAITIIVAALAAAEARGEQRARKTQCGVRCCRPLGHDGACWGGTNP